MAPNTGSGPFVGGSDNKDNSSTITRKEPADSLDLSEFLSCLEHEVGDLHSTIKASRDDRVEKAFQRVPRSMRRRTASHNAKRVPRRLRQQAHRDHAADNTPSVATGLAKRKKARPASAWVYENTKKRVKLQQEKKLAAQGDGVDNEINSDDDNDAASDFDDDNGGAAVVAAVPRPPLPIMNLRLPTHRWQAKRAQMDNPGFLWNTTIVRTPANKTYRMSLRAASLKPGMCACWDTSYKATIYLRGLAKHVDEALAAVVEPHLLTSALRSGACCVDAKLPRPFAYQQAILGDSSSSNSSFGELGGPGNCGAMTVFYNPTTADTITDDIDREVFLRVHPTLFSHVWTALNKEIARKQLPVAVRDFRLEIGSIDVTGSAAAEILAATLYPYETKTTPMEPQGKEFLKLRNIDTTVLATSSGAMLAFNIQDPRLDEPAADTNRDDVDGGLLAGGSSTGLGRSHNVLQTWPATTTTSAAVQRRPSGLFDTMARHNATKQLPQAVLDKRRGKLATGERLLVNPQCRPIPVIFAAADGASSVPAAADPHSGSSSSSASPTWTLLAPRACIDAIWLRLHLQRLRSGQRPLNAGLEEERHMALERGRPWFPADFPGTPTGWDWELQSRRRQEKEWNEKPTAKRTQWKVVELGNGTKGETGSGFACDWEYLFGVDPVPATLAAVGSSSTSENEDTKSKEDQNIAGGAGMDVCDAEAKDDTPGEEGDSDGDNGLEEAVQFEALRPQRKAMPAVVRSMQHATWADIRAAVQTTRLQRPVVWRTPYQLMTISVQLLWGGVPDARARIYRLPETDQGKNLRARWLALANSDSHNNKRRELGHSPPRPPQPRRMPADADTATRKKLLAQSLLETRLPYPRPVAAVAGAFSSDEVGYSPDLHLPIPGRDDLVGFVTSGAHRFQSGKGFGIGHVNAQKLVEAIVAADGEAERGVVSGADRERERRVPINRDARFCIVRNAGERVGHLARWTPISS